MRNPTPYRVIVFGTGQRVVGRGKKRRTEPVGFAYVGWTEDQTAEPARLAGSGSFCFPGLHAAYRAAIGYLELPATTQVVVKTNQDKALYRYFKQADGRITGYAE